MRDTRTPSSLCARPVIVALAFFFLASSIGAQVPRKLPSPPQTIPADDIFKFGVSLDVGWFSDFSKGVAAQTNLETSKADDVAPGFGASLELSPRGMRPFFTRVALNFGIQDFEQTYSPASPLDPTNADGRVYGLFVDGQLGLRVFRSRRSVFTLMTGPTWTRNDADIDFDYAGIPANVDRVENGWKWNAGANLWRSIDDRLGFQIGVTYTNSFKKPDADQNWRLSTGLTLGFGGDGY